MPRHFWKSAAVLTVVLGVSFAARSQSPPPVPSSPSITSTKPDLSTLTQHQIWVQHALEKMHSVKVSMTRAQLLVLFERAGGSQLVYSDAPLRRTYSYRDCQNFKIDVDFKPFRTPPPNSGELNSPYEDPKDVITKISTPIVDYIGYD